MRSCGRKPLQELNGDHQIAERGLGGGFKQPKHVDEQEEEEKKEASLAEELCAFKKKLQRLREERLRTEQLLAEREEAMEVKMKQLLERGETQKKVEMEVDRLFRLKELLSSSSKISPIRTLREKEHERRNCTNLESQEAEASEEEEEEKPIKDDVRLSFGTNPIAAQKTPERQEDQSVV